MSATGGRRAGQGRTTSFTAERRAKGFAAAVEAFQNPEDLKRAYDVLKDLAGIGLGCRIMAKIRMTAQQKRQLLLEGEEEFERSDGSKLWVYRRAPDLKAIQVLIEHGKGKAATAPREVADTVIHLVTSVPRPPKEEE